MQTKIKTKSNWRRWGRQILGELISLGFVLLLLNMIGGLYRMDNDLMMPAYRPGDLLILQKLLPDYDVGDLVLYCVDGCGVGRIVDIKSGHVNIETNDGNYILEREELCGKVLVAVRVRDL